MIAELPPHVRRTIRKGLRRLGTDELYKILPVPPDVDPKVADAIRIVITTLVRPSSCRSFAGVHQISETLLRKMATLRLRAQGLRPDLFEDAFRWMRRAGLLIVHRRAGLSVPLKLDGVREDARSLLVVAFALHDAGTKP